MCVICGGGYIDMCVIWGGGYMDMIASSSHVLSFSPSGACVSYAEEDTWTCVSYGEEDTWT